MIQIVRKPTDTPTDDSTSMVGYEFQKRKVPFRYLDLSAIDAFGTSVRGDVIWICGMVNDGAQFEVLSALALHNRVVNTPEAIATCANKVQTSALLIQAGIPTPVTFFSFSKEEAHRFINIHGGAVSKPVYGFDGNGVVMVQPGQDPGKPPYYLQEYIENDRDFRVFVIDGEAVGAISRQSDSLTHNIHQGGTGKPVAIPESMARIASAAARAVGADYCGVDLLSLGEGYTVLEVNGTPNWHCMDAPIPALLTEYLIRCQDEGKP